MKDIRDEARASQAAKLKRMTGDEKQDKTMMGRMVHEHEGALHKGEPKTKFATGGAVTGMAAKPRLDRPARARGGKVGRTNVNVIIAQKPDQPQAMPMAGAGPTPSPIPAPAPPPMPPPGMPPPGLGAMMGGGMPGLRSAGGRAEYKRGGSVKGKPRYMTVGTPPEPSPGKNDLDKISTKPPLLTRKRGGKVDPSLHMTAGAESGEGRLQKTRAQKRVYP